MLTSPTPYDGRWPTSTTDQRAVVVLRYFAHLTEQQTASVLGIAPGTVKSRLSRALARRPPIPSCPTRSKEHEHA